jgi:hypothetical protein
MEFQFSSILKYLKSLMGDFLRLGLLTVFLMKIIFSTLGEDNKFINDDQKIDWDDKSILSSDSRTKETELQIQKILELQHIVSNLSNVFTDYKGVIKSLNPVVNAPC